MRQPSRRVSCLRRFTEVDPVSDKSGAVLPITPRSPVASQKAGSTSPHIAPADFGERLLRGREQTKRSLGEIADTTKISIHLLRALERGDLHRLPDGIYRRAIVRQYAEAVSLNVEETLRDLASVWTEVDVDSPTPEAVAHPRRDPASTPFTTALWSTAAALVALGAVAAVATAWYRAETPAPAADAPVKAPALRRPAPTRPQSRRSQQPMPCASQLTACRRTPEISNAPRSLPFCKPRRAVSSRATRQKVSCGSPRTRPARA